MAADMSDWASLTLFMASSISLLEASAFRLALRFKPAAKGFSLKERILVSWLIAATNSRFLYAVISNCIRAQKELLGLTLDRSWTLTAGQPPVKGTKQQLKRLKCLMVNTCSQVSDIHQSLSPVDSCWLLGIQMPPLHPCSEHRTGFLPSATRTDAHTRSDVSIWTRPSVCPCTQAGINIISIFWQIGRPCIHCHHPWILYVYIICRILLLSLTPGLDMGFGVGRSPPPGRIPATAFAGANSDKALASSGIDPTEE